MKGLILAMAILAVPATAMANVPQSGTSKCWISTDSSRGFGFWTQCDGETHVQSPQQTGRQPTFTPPVGHPAQHAGVEPNAGDGGGDGGGGGGGGGGGR